MATNTKYRIGLAMSIFGIALLLINAADYIMNWNQLSSGIAVIGIALVIIGADFIKRAKDNEKKN